MNRSLLLFLGAVALGGGVFYLYRSGKLVSAPGEMAVQATPKQVFRANLNTARRIDPNLLIGYYW